MLLATSSSSTVCTTASRHGRPGCAHMWSGALLTMLDMVQSAVAFPPSGPASHQLAEAEHSLSATPRRLSGGPKKGCFPQQPLPKFIASAMAPSATFCTRCPKCASTASRCRSRSAALHGNAFDVRRRHLACRLTTQSHDSDALCPFPLPCRACSRPQDAPSVRLVLRCPPALSHCAQQLRATL